MSRWMDHAEALAAHFRTEIPACADAVAEDERVDVVVMRQHDLLALVNAAVGKSKGLCLVIAWTGGNNPDRKSKRLRMGGRYSISVWSLPVMEGDLKADDLLEQALEAAHGFVTASGPNDATRRLAVDDAALVPHTTFLIYEAKAEVLRL